jgi:DMSO/TMAO reductase YedYZ molybdopterin-dependent catalytic subunit
VPASRETRLYGRRAFLGATAVGLSSLLWGRSAWNAFVSVAPPSLVPGWRIYTVAATMPQFDPVMWRLRIDGLVQREMTLSYDELRSLPSAEQVSTFHCVTGWTVHDVHWRGVRFADLLSAAGARPDARVLTFTSAERPYVDTLTLEQAHLPDAMLAYDMNGKPLARQHGAPVRVVIPDMYGYKGVKWVERITLSTEAQPGYWEQRGYDADAWVGRSNGF